MSRKLSLTLLLIVLALPLRAETQITVTPNPPTTSDVVELRIPYCPPNSPPVVERTGFTIKVTFPLSVCANPPIYFPQLVSLPPLPAGEYRVEVRNTDPDSELWSTTSFVVVEAERPFDIHPTVVPRTPDNTILFYVAITETLARFCEKGCTYRVGGNVATPVDGSRDGFVVLTAPPHDPGFVDVVISNGSQTLVSRNAVYYFDRTAPPDPAVFERVLFPVLFSARGENGSDWRSEAVMLNTNAWPIVTYSDGTFEADHPLVWPGRPEYPQGTALLVPRQENLSVALRVRDVSRVAEGFGTEIPVVSESQMFRGTMTLLDVPFDPDYRVKLRIYAWGDIPAGDLGRIKGVGTFAMTRSCSTAARCLTTPWYAEIDLPNGAEGAHANLYVTPPAGASLAWTFASVTNNETQQVTIVTPDGSGGEPCMRCWIP